ncbi:MAG: thioredoxin family protein [Holophaga sp.]|nr:thioredoxin family protein [Holophaga sp.]
MSIPCLSALILIASAGLSAQNAVPALDPAGLTQILKSGKWTVIEFGGPTCIPCKKMQPILAELQQHFGARAQVRNFYVTEHPKASREYKVMAMPTQVVFDPSGKEVTRHIGFWEKGDFLAALAKAGLK